MRWSYAKREKGRRSVRYSPSQVTWEAEQKMMELLSRMSFILVLFQILLNYDILGWGGGRISFTTALLSTFFIFHQLCQQLLRHSVPTLNSSCYLTSLSNVLAFKLNVMAELYWFGNPFMTDVSKARKLMPFEPGNRICSVRTWLLMVQNFSRYSTLYWTKKFLRTSPVNGTDCAHVFYDIMGHIAAEKGTETPANVLLAKYGA